MTDASKNLRYKWKRSRQTFTECPVTGEQTKKLSHMQVVVPNGRASWWHCSACQGWHITLENESKWLLNVSH